MLEPTIQELDAWSDHAEAALLLESIRERTPDFWIATGLTASEGATAIEGWYVQINARLWTVVSALGEPENVEPWAFDSALSPEVARDEYEASMRASM